MPVVAAGLMICEKCGAREVCAILMRKSGPSAEAPAGWYAGMRAVVAAGEPQVECLCPTCKPAPVDSVS